MKVPIKILLFILLLVELLDIVAPLDYNGGNYNEQYYDGKIGIQFIRGDSNGDKKVDISDVIFTLDALFKGGQLPRCWKSADANDDGIIDITDTIYTLSALFMGGVQIPQPYPNIRDDPTEDNLACICYGSNLDCP